MFLVGWFRELDRILRGEVTQPEALRTAGLRIPLLGITVVTVVLAVFYGLCMGLFTVLRTGAFSMQLVASAVKTPMLFWLTLAVTFPSLYVFNALAGSQLGVRSVFAVLLAGLGVLLALLASLGPIVVFFTVSTTSYRFMVLLNVAFGTLAGVVGLLFLVRTLHRFVMLLEYPPPAGQPPVPAQVTPQSQPAPPLGVLGTLDLVRGYRSAKAFSVTTIWAIMFALVGAQMSWVLRPFIGNPAQPFQWLRTRESDFFSAVLKALYKLLTS